MKRSAFTVLLLLIPSFLFCQTIDPLLDSLIRPLPDKAGVKQQAIQLKNILQHILHYRTVGLGDYPKKLDSLNRCCIAGKTGDRRFEIWVDAISAYYSNSDNYERSEEGIRILNKAMHQFEILGDSNMVGAALTDLCYYAQATGDSLAFTNYQLRARKIAPHMDDLFFHWRMLASIGSFCKTFGKFDEGLEYLFEAYALVEHEKTSYASPLQRIILRHIAIAYREFNEFDNSLFYLEKSTQYGKEDIISESEYNLVLGDIYYGKKDWKKYLETLKMTKLLPDEPSFKLFNARLIASQAQCYRELGDPKKGLLLAQKAVGNFPVETRTAEGASFLRELAECELANGMIDLALKHGLQAHHANLIVNTSIQLFKSAQLLSKVYEAQKNFKKAHEFSTMAFKYYEKTELLRNGMLIAAKTFERNNAVKTARREAEVKAQLDQQRNIRYALFAGLTILALLTYLLYNRFKIKQRNAEQLEAKNLEVEVARRRAEASEAFKARFLANMSHEIRTPLHGITGFADLLLDTALTEKQRRWLNSINHSSERLGEVVNDILDLSKLEAAQISLRKIPYSPTRVATDVQESLALKAETKGLELRLDIGETVPAAVIGDPTRLYQILMNLVGNAVKFTAKGSVTLSIQNLPHVEGDACILFTVTDTGIGIDPEKIATVFNSFKQANEDTTAIYGGTGLGLTIARELVQLNGSEIHVKSELNKGSTFSFTLEQPFSEESDIAEFKFPDHTIYFSQPLQILLVEDHTLNREIAIIALERHFENAHIIEAVNGKEAVEILNACLSRDQNLPDLVLMDIQMPEMTGPEATKYIRQHISADIPIIALTASATLDDIENALASGMNRHLSKPFKSKELARTISETLELNVSKSKNAFSTSGKSFNPSNENSNPFDLTFLQDFTDGDEAQMEYFIQKFLGYYPSEINRLKIALETGDYEAMFQVAHRFKPQLEFFGLQEAASLTFQLEQGAQRKAVIPELAALLALLIAELQSLNVRYPTADKSYEKTDPDIILE